MVTSCAQFDPPWPFVTRVPFGRGLVGVALHQEEYSGASHAVIDTEVLFGRHGKVTATLLHLTEQSENRSSHKKRPLLCAWPEPFWSQFDEWALVWPSCEWLAASVTHRLPGTDAESPSGGGMRCDEHGPGRHTEKFNMRTQDWKKVKYKRSTK